jgi:hypothetical protein
MLFWGTVRTTFLVGEREIPLSKMRQVIGQRLSESKREAPHFYVTGEFDPEQAVQRLIFIYSLPVLLQLKVRHSSLPLCQRILYHLRGL